MKLTVDTEDMTCQVTYTLVAAFHYPFLVVGTSVIGLAFQAAHTSAIDKSRHQHS